MKKLFKVLFSGAAAVGCAVAFSACGNGGGKDEGATVTQTKWQTALSYFTVDWDDNEYRPKPNDNPRTNFKCETVTVSDGMNSTVISSVDYKKLAVSCKFSVNGADQDGTYAWKENGKYYEIGVGWRTDEESGKIIEFYTKSEKELSDDVIKLSFDTGIYSYAGGEHISGLNLAEKYDEFTYAAADEKYTASLYYESYEANAEVTMKFEDGMLTYFSVNIANSKYGSLSDSFTYTYGISVTVPDYFLNLPVGETIKNND